MRIAQVAPLFESVPPKMYGGTERVVSYLTEELIRQGHDVTLFATADSRTAARLVPIWPCGLRLDPSSNDPLAPHVMMLDRLRQHADDFDLIHFHCDYWHFPLSRTMRWMHVTTLHGRLDLPDLVPLYRQFDEMPLVSISNSQRQPLPWVNWQATIYHGLPLHLHRPRPAAAHEYLLFLGRICDEKRPDRAIEIARRTGVPLKIAAKVDRCEREYFETTIKPLLDGPLVEFIGEVGGAAKDELLGGALALVCPIDWPEPFGLVMIEAMASGTPVIAWRCGSVPEVVDDGVSGFIVESIDEAARAVEKARALDRRQVRAQFERRFSAERMAREYVAVYERLLEAQAPAGARPALAKIA